MSRKLKLTEAEKYRRYMRGPFKHPKMPLKRNKGTKKNVHFKRYLNNLLSNAKKMKLLCQEGLIRQESSIRGLRFREESATPEPPSRDELEPNMTVPQQDPMPSNTSNMWPELWIYDDKISHCKRCGKNSKKRSYRGLSVCECWCSSLFDSKPPPQKTKYIDPFHACAEENFYRLFLRESMLPILEHHMAWHMNLTPNMRSVLVNWVHAVHSKLRLCDGVFEMAIATIDRYLQQWVKDISPSDLNLMGFSALVLASKYENPKMTHIQWFLKHTDAGFTDEMISEMVLQILLAINCDLSRPVPSQFLKRLCNATADFGIKCQKLAHYYVQLALMDAELASVKPSQIAAAALYIALNLSDGTPDGGLDESLWTRQLADCSRYTSLQLRATVLRMAQLPLKAEQEELLSIRNKFSRRKYYSVSVAPELKGPRLESIMNIPENEPSSLSQLPLKAEQVPMSIRQKCSRRKYNSVLVAPELKEPRLESIVNIPEKIPRSIRFKQTFCNLM